MEMKSWTVVLGAVALVWCAVLTWQTNRPPVVAEGAAVVAFLHGDTLNANYQLVQDKQSWLMQEVAQVDSGLIARSKVLDAEARELILFAQSDQVTKEELAMAGGRMREIEAEVERLTSGAKQLLSQQERLFQQEIAERLSVELEAFAVEEGIDVILNWGLSGEGVLYGSDGYDITEPLIEFLNTRYEAE
jgi:Skp family chaperone for outer membrane proteins